MATTPILNYEPAGASPMGNQGPRDGNVYYWPDIDNPVGGQIETDLDAQDISVLPDDALIIVFFIGEDESHWLRVLKTDESNPVSNVGAGLIVPTNFDITKRPYVLIRQFTGTGGGGGGGALIGETGSATLINGQGYVDVAFAAVQSDTSWQLVAHSVVNTTDPAPLNLMPAVITSKTVSGFRIQFSGLPDSGEYKLDWALGTTTGTAASIGENGSQALIAGQNYVTVSFVTSQLDTSWILTGCSIVNTTDASPLNLIPCTMTSKTVSGFTIQLNGMPDTGNYNLVWALGVPVI